MLQSFFLFNKPTFLPIREEKLFNINYGKLPQGFPLWKILLWRIGLVNLKDAVGPFGRWIKINEPN